MKKAMVITFVVFLCLAVLSAAGAVYYFCFYPQDTGILELTLHGERQITVDYGSAYEESGAAAVFTSSDPEIGTVEVKVTQQGQADPMTPGIYIIKYLARYEDHVATVYRRVQVVDICPPEIALTVVEGSYTLPGHPYQEEGFAATDDCDGDITDRVQRTEKDGIVTYTVADRAGNVATAQRTITYNDPEPPVLTLNGSDYITLRVGTTYEEPGYTATDNCDGDITAKVQISGGPDVYKPGTYILTYTVQDSYGNQVSAQRTVCVLPMDEQDIAAPTGKVIYLTFDDGPGPDTDRLLDVLGKYNVKATFFVVNTAYISKISRAAQEGHTVAIHTATHKFNQVYASEEAYFNDLYTMQSVIESYTGIKPMLLRFPGGSSNTISANYNKGIMSRLTQQVTELGFQYFDWNVDSKDAWNASTSWEVFNNVISGIGDKEQSVVLQHDIRSYSVDAVERIIVWGLTNGYRFAALDANGPTCHHGVNN